MKIIQLFVASYVYTVYIYNMINRLNIDSMNDQVHISPSDFTNTKQGYRKFLTALGYGEQMVKDIASGSVPASFYMVPSFKAFKQAHETEETKLDALYTRLEKLNDRWGDLLDEGQDDTDMYQDAFHIKKNAANLVRQIEEFEQSIFYKP